MFLLISEMDVTKKRHSRIFCKSMQVKSKAAQTGGKTIIPLATLALTESYMQECNWGGGFHKHVLLFSCWAQVAIMLPPPGSWPGFH